MCLELAVLRKEKSNFLYVTKIDNNYTLNDLESFS